MGFSIKREVERSAGLSFLLRDLPPVVLKSSPILFEYGLGPDKDQRGFPIRPNPEKQYPKDAVPFLFTRK